MNVVQLSLITADAPRYVPPKQRTAADIVAAMGGKEQPKPKNSWDALAEAVGEGEKVKR